MLTEMNNNFKITLPGPCVFKILRMANMENSDFLLLVRLGMTWMNISFSTSDFDPC